jgi:hypothetical protein
MDTKEGATNEKKVERFTELSRQKFGASQILST